MPVPDNWPVLLALGLSGPLIGGVAAWFAAKLTTRPAMEQSQTARFTALLERQDRDIAKLERVASDLEIMVIRLIEWADEATLVASHRGVELPERPKFKHIN